MATKVSIPEAYKNSNIRFIPYGTIGWIKDAQNIVHQCRCLGGKWENVKGTLQPVYNWQIAGVGVMQCGKYYWQLLDCSIIYCTKEYADFGSSTNYYVVEHFEDKIIKLCEIDLPSILMDKYGLEKKCMKIEELGAFNYYLTINAYTLMKDETIKLLDTDFEIVIDKNGVDCIVPFLEHSVDGFKKRYATYEEAVNARKPCKVVTFDDEEETPDTPKSTKLTLTIEIETSMVDELKKIGVIIKE